MLHDDSFPITRWSLVTTAQKGAEQQATKAWSELFQMYWYPVYGYVRRRGHSSHDAEDITQAFFGSLFKRNFVTDVAEGRGRLRGFLLAALKNFLIDHHRRETSIKRGGGAPIISIDQAEAEHRFIREAVDKDSPDVPFERSWAQTLLQDVLGKLQASYGRAEKEEIFMALSSCLLSDESPDYRSLSVRLGCTVISLRVQFYRLKQRFGELLVDEIRHTVSSNEEAEEERAYLLKVLS